MKLRFETKILKKNTSYWHIVLNTMNFEKVLSDCSFRVLLNNNNNGPKLCMWKMIEQKMTKPNNITRFRKLQTDKQQVKEAINFLSAEDDHLIAF
ncbi:hypothetical protein T05_16103 [Trichinella murrelli]|uniref:Uncharacterized protein n=1 Tax=Trichinella murrelli TaxID=144512 RepID=A0A0V0U7K9_9BILA|nr:hypothetical protein T05_16103 [Trichinella murrelli]